MLHGTEHTFWLALAQFAQSRHAGSKRPSKLQKEIHRFQRRAQGSPANFRARALILRGEGVSVARRSDAALALSAKRRKPRRNTTNRTSPRSLIVFERPNSHAAAAPMTRDDISPLPPSNTGARARTVSLRNYRIYRATTFPRGASLHELSRFPTPGCQRQLLHRSLDDGQ
jgi:hypothetical protein